jgi:hypothetical protein
VCEEKPVSIICEPPSEGSGLRKSEIAVIVLVVAVLGTVGGLTYFAVYKKSRKSKVRH